MGVGVNVGVLFLSVTWVPYIVLMGVWGSVGAPVYLYSPVGCTGVWSSLCPHGGGSECWSTSIFVFTCTLYLSMEFTVPSWGWEWVWEYQYICIHLYAVLEYGVHCALMGVGVSVGVPGLLFTCTLYWSMEFIVGVGVSVGVPVYLYSPVRCTGVWSSLCSDGGGSPVASRVGGSTSRVLPGPTLPV